MGEVRPEGSEGSMIQPLRKRHRLAVFALAILLPLILAAGLAARHPVPINGNFGKLSERLGRPSPERIVK